MLRIQPLTIKYQLSEVSDVSTTSLFVGRVLFLVSTEAETSVEVCLCTLTRLASPLLTVRLSLSFQPPSFTINSFSAWRSASWQTRWRPSPISRPLQTSSPTAARNECLSPNHYKESFADGSRRAWNPEPLQGREEMWHVLRQQCGVAGGSVLVSDDIHGIGAPFVRGSAVIGKRYCQSTTPYSVRSTWWMTHLTTWTRRKPRGPTADQLRCRG